MHVYPNARETFESIDMESKIYRVSKYFIHACVGETRSCIWSSICSYRTNVLLATQLVQLEEKLRIAPSSIFQGVYEFMSW